ncbi:hypothetical protein [Streptomyces sp. TE33382]
MTTPSLQDGIDEAGSPADLLWKPGAEPWTPEVVEREYVGWRQEQRAWHEGVALLNLSHHMFDMWIEGPDATRVLTEYGANNFETFAVGQAKQYVPVTRHGHIISDGILSREAENAYVLSGVPAAQHWVQFHAEKGGYDVAFATDPSSAFRPGGGDPKLFRYRIQGPLALELIGKVLGGPIPETKFFHSTQVTLNGRAFKALRHGMAGQAGYEFIGPWEHAAYVHEAFLKAGEPLGLVRVGALAYATPGVESGWIPSPVPGIYSDPELAEYRAWLPLFGIEGKRPLKRQLLLGEHRGPLRLPVRAGVREADPLRARIPRPGRPPECQGGREPAQEGDTGLRSGRCAPGDRWGRGHGFRAQLRPPPRGDPPPVWSASPCRRPPSTWSAPSWPRR